MGELDVAVKTIKREHYIPEISCEKALKVMQQVHLLCVRQHTPPVLTAVVQLNLPYLRQTAEGNALCMCSSLRSYLFWEQLIHLQLLRAQW